MDIYFSRQNRVLNFRTDLTELTKYESEKDLKQNRRKRTARVEIGRSSEKRLIPRKLIADLSDHLAKY